MLRPAGNGRWSRDLKNVSTLVITLALAVHSSSNLIIHFQSCNLRAVCGNSKVACGSVAPILLEGSHACAADGPSHAPSLFTSMPPQNPAVSILQSQFTTLFIACFWRGCVSVAIPCVICACSKPATRQTKQLLLEYRPVASPRL